MINNDVKNQLSRYFNNRASQSETGGASADLIKRLRAKHDAIQGKGARTEGDEAAAKAENQDKAEKGKTIPFSGYGRGVYKNAKRTGTSAAEKQAAAEKEKEAETASKKDKSTAADDDSNLSPQERRKKELDAIMDRLNKEEEARWGNRFNKNKSSDKTGKTDNAVTTPQDGAASSSTSDSGGISGFLNDMPLFNEFKTGLMDAFKKLDSASAGSISAQYELNYTSMQYIANAAGGYDYQETTVSVKLDLNYIKAAAGNNATSKEITDAIDKSTDFESLVENLKGVGQGQQQVPQQTKVNPQDFLTSMQDYFSPEKTAGRIVDFATAFFPMSDAFKKGGDTEEARAEFAEMMRDAIQKGFDQAQGILGVVPKETQAGIDKTHELTMAGLDDFIKNGLNKQKQDQGVYSALEQFAFSAEVSYSQKSVSVRTGSYNSSGATQNAQQNQSAVDTSA